MQQVQQALLLVQEQQQVPWQPQLPEPLSLLCCRMGSWEKESKWS